jgi:cobalt-precorrin 5A hydrolase
MIAVGIGARSVATASEVVSAVREAAERSGIDVSDIGAIAGLDKAETFAALGAAARRLGVRVLVFDSARLAAEGPRCTTQSTRSLAATGVPSVAEAAALCATGPLSMLVLSRIVCGSVTAAIAAGPDEDAG